MDQKQPTILTCSHVELKFGIYGMQWNRKQRVLFVATWAFHVSHICAAAKNTYTKQEALKNLTCGTTKHTIRLSNKSLLNTYV